jgi:amidase
VKTSATSIDSYATATECAAALAARTVSSLELVEHAIDRIEARDGALNAVVVRDFERAREAARAADAALARGESAPLLGVPMTVKESFSVAGLQTTWGMPAFAGQRPERDALAISRLKGAGAVVLGKTNVPLALADWQSYNDVYGTTNNPWDVGRTPGGSSGGGAASLAAGFVPLEIGSDIGGSLRVPAHFCGIYAHKPSFALLPMRGHSLPGTDGAPPDLSVIGPMARSAADLALAIDILAGPDEAMGVAYRLELPRARHEALRDYRVLVVDSLPQIPTDSDVRGAIDGLAGALAAAGVAVSRSSALLPDFEPMSRVYTRMLQSALSLRMPLEVLDRMAAAAAELSPDDDSLNANRLRSARLGHREWLADNDERARIGRRWAALFREFDVVLAPISPTPAFPHDHSNPQEARRLSIDGVPHGYLDQVVYAGIATLTGLPATAAPLGRSKSGLPVGVQIVGPFLEDRTPLAFAAHLEREFGGFTPPPGFSP